MRRSNPLYMLKNFRVFGSSGAEFEIAPITIITGSNSSGKSSVIKSLMLLNDLFSRVKGNNLNFDKYILEFISGKHNLGTYESAISRFADTNEMVFGYRVFSEFIWNEVNVVLTFGLDEKNILKNAQLLKLEIFCDDEALIRIDVDEKTKKVKFTSNINLLKSYFFDFMEIKDRLYNPLYRKHCENPEENIYKAEGLYEDEQTSYLYEGLINLKRKEKERNFSFYLMSEYGDANYEQKLLFYLPFEKHLEKCSKNNLISEFDDLIIKCSQEKKVDFKDEKISIPLKITCAFLEGYIKSEYNSLIEYFRALENMYLKLKFKNEFEIESIFSENKERIIQSTFSLNPISVQTCLSGSLINSISETDFKSIISDLKNNSIFKNEKLSSENDFLRLHCALFLVFDKICPNFSKDRKFDNKESIMYNDQYLEFIRRLEYELYLDFISDFLKETVVFLPSFLNNNKFVDAIRVINQRMYSYRDQTTEFSSSMIKYLNAKSSSIYEAGTFIKKWIKEFEVADDIIFKPTEDGLGVHIYIVKENTETLLADEGYGITQLLSLLIEIELNILKAPYFYEGPFGNFSKKYRESTITIEEPEINLHPKFQSKLSELMWDAYDNYNVHFIIETHSEYLIRKLQTMVAKKTIKNTEIALYYINKYDQQKSPANKPQVIKINIKDDGRLSEPFGSGFLDEADNLAMDLLILKSIN